MPSIVPGYEYDIFISYRHKDNKGDHWVTEFVKALKTELDATFKEDISIYFDENPHDGLLEMHDVDDSLRDKLRCLIFIPIISQTYCDPKSFAWIHEFLAFKKLASADQFGLKIKLTNGNVSSRILPIKIHDLDLEDKTTIESEVGGVLRAIEFIYKEPGVNRPLKLADRKSENQSKTDYTNQVNKVANAIKEIITTLKKPISLDSRPTKYQSSPTKRRSKISISILLLLFLGVTAYWSYAKLFSVDTEVNLDKSIAVLPFVDMSEGKDQEYLGDGIADEIINTLSKVKEIKVIGRTSSFQFKGEKVDLREIGAKLQVATVMQGSVMKSGNKIRIRAQLINVEDASIIWSESYEREIQNVFFILDEIANRITQKLALSILKTDYNQPSVPTTNMEAYEMAMKGRFFLLQGPSGAVKAREYYQKAIELDSNYAEAQLGFTGTFLFMGSKEEMRKSINKLKRLHPDPVALNTLIFVYYFFREGDWKKSKRFYDSTLAAGFSPDITCAYYEGAIEKNVDKAIQTLERIIEKDPLFLDGLRNLAWFYIWGEEYGKANETISQMIEISGDYVESYQLKAEVYLREKKFEQALEECLKAEERFKNQKKFLETRIRAMVGIGKLSEAKKLFYDSKIKDDPRLNWKLPIFYFSLGLEEEAFEWMNQEATKNPSFVISMLIDPFYDPFRNDPRYKQVISKLNLPE